MYAYEKKKNHKNAIMLGSGITLLAFVCAGAILLQNMESPQPVMQEEVIISLPDKKETKEETTQTTETIIAPFNVEAKIVQEYYDGSEHEVSDVSVFDGIYRPNQGIDYAYNEESFDVVCMISGEVSEVKEDELFGNSVSITSGDLIIMYQSLDAINYQVGDRVAQNDVIAKAGTNVYHPDLGNHVHIVVTKNNTLLNPKTVIGNTLDSLQ